MAEYIDPLACHPECHMRWVVKPHVHVADVNNIMAGLGIWIEGSWERLLEVHLRAEEWPLVKYGARVVRWHGVVDGPPFGRCMVTFYRVVEDG